MRMPRRRGCARTGRQGLCGKVVGVEAAQQGADGAQAEPGDDLCPDVAVGEDLLGHHQQVGHRAQAREQRVPACPRAQGSERERDRERERERERRGGGAGVRRGARGALGVFQFAERTLSRCASHPGRCRAPWVEAGKAWQAAGAVAPAAHAQAQTGGRHGKPSRRRELRGSGAGAGAGDAPRPALEPPRVHCSCHVQTGRLTSLAACQQLKPTKDSGLLGADI